MRKLRVWRDRQPGDLALCSAGMALMISTSLIVRFKPYRMQTCRVWPRVGNKYGNSDSAANEPHVALEDVQVHILALLDGTNQFIHNLGGGADAGLFWWQRTLVAEEKGLRVGAAYSKHPGRQFRVQADPLLVHS